MSTIPEPGRQAAHILLDSIAAWSAEAGVDVNGPARNLALARLNEVGAVTATMDEHDVLDVDASDLVGAATLVMHWMTEFLATSTGWSRERIIAEARAFVDFG